MELEEEDFVSSRLSGQCLNMLAQEVDASHRLLNLTPTPIWEKPRGAFVNRTKCEWEAGYAVSPAVEAWAQRVRDADASEPARVVGVVGATSAGKSWLVGKLLDEFSPKPCRLEEQFDGMTLQSMTSDINMYADSSNDIYYLDFEGTYGTQPVHLGAPDLSTVMERCLDPKAWETKRRQALKECFQPTLAYLTCNIIIFLTREKLVCSRSLEECEHFAQAANSRVVSALPPALIIIQNCCRPSEGIFDSEQCTAAFIQTHFGNNCDWQKYFRSIDCFCIPDELLMCKRSGFDGEEMCNRVLNSLKSTISQRLDSDLAFRLHHEVRLSQLQWFSVVSALCRIVNDNDTVKMASLYMRAGATSCGLGDIKATLLLLMGGKLKCSVTVHEQLQVALSIIARLVVRRDISEDECGQLLVYLRGLFPCGAIASKEVECFDKSVKEVICGQMRLFHNTLHRSNTLVRTVEADWIRGITEFLRGGITHAWVGEFECHAAFQEYDDNVRLLRDLAEEVEEYKLLKCLEGVSEDVGSPWVMKAHESLQSFSSKIRRDTSQMCIICMAQGHEPGFFSRIWLPPEGSHLPVCDHCYSILEKHDVCGPDSGVDVLKDPCCEGCQRRDPWSGVRSPDSGKRFADHRLFPCRCSVCKTCAESVITEEYPDCPSCGQPLRKMVDERALVRNTWVAAVRGNMRPQEISSCTSVCLGVCR